MSAPTVPSQPTPPTKHENPLITYQWLGVWRQSYRRQPFLYIFVFVTMTLFYGLFLMLELRYPESIETVHLDFLFLFVVVLVVPLFAHGRIALEYENATWEFLALTRLTAKEIFVGKWGSAMLALALLIFFALLFYMPVIVIGSTFATMTRQLEKAFFSLMLITSWGALLVSVGTWIAYRVRRTLSTIALMYAFQVMVLLMVPWLFAIFGIPPGMVAQAIYRDSSSERIILGDFMTRVDFWWSAIKSLEIVYWLNPFYALAVFDYSTNNSLAWGGLYDPLHGWLWVQSIIYLAVSFLLAMHTYRRLRREWRKN